MSDVDIAIYFSSNVAIDKYQYKRFNLMTKLNSVLKKEVDGMVLNNRYDELVIEILKFGKLFFEQDSQIKNNFRYGTFYVMPNSIFKALNIV